MSEMAVEHSLYTGQLVINMSGMGAAETESSMVMYDGEHNERHVNAAFW